MAVYPAIDVLRLEGHSALKGRTIGLLTHLAACDMRFIPTVDVLTRTPDVKVKRLFTPEHGFSATVPDGVHVESSVDPHTHLPITSLYGANFKPEAADFDGIDLVVVDLQDVGARCYTYLWTLSLMLEACGEHGVEVLVLDRPNPLGGEVRGLLVEPDCASFVGRYPYSVPMCHGMTLGELARFFNAEFNPTPCELKVLAVSGWTRAMRWRETRLAWVPTSPAIPTHTTVQHYPGACLLEGTTISEGRGTALPFEVAGAPYIDGFLLADLLNKQHNMGVRFRPHAFRPTASKHKGEDCQGVQVHITDTRIFDPIRVWLNVIVGIRALYPDEFSWAAPHDGLYHFDRLIGTTAARKMIDADATVNDVLSGERVVRYAFLERRQPYLLYG